MATKPRRIDGVDTSHHQSGEHNLASAKKAGVDFWYHKATEGASFRDAKYVQRRREAQKAGIPFGAYHFARPENGDASLEAKFFLQVAQPQPGDLVPALDIEVNDARMSRAELTRWIANWVAQIQRVVHVKPLIYTPFDLDSDFGCLLWQPRYNDSNTPPVAAEPWRRWDIWQFSNGQLGVPDQVPGFGRVDINTMRDGLRVREFRIPEIEKEPPEPTRTGKLRFVSQNVKALPLMPQFDVVEDVVLTASQAHVVGWQEIGIPRYDDAVMSLDPKVWGHFFAGMRRQGGYESPISYRKEMFKATDGDALLLSPANAAISHRKYFTWVVLEHIPSGAHILVTNKHYIAGAWRKDKHDKKLRQQIWRESRDEVELPFLRQFIKDHPNMPIVNLGDYNAQLAGGNDSEEYPRKIANRTIYFLTKERSIDQVMLINGKKWKWDIDDEDGELLPGRNSDHQGRRGTARLKKVTK
jgi:GH25 family lysozyme M1 (1,4-beta-N-acetylmuramidase)